MYLLPRLVKLTTMRKFPPLLVLLFWTSIVYGQTFTAPILTTAQAQALVERSLAAELHAIQNTNHPMRYRLRKSSPRLTSTKEMIETRDGEVARLIALNDQPLSAANEQKEQARLNALINNPSRQQHRKRSQETDTRIVLKLLRALPHAFLYEYKGHGQGAAARLERFTFQPDPNFDPPDMETQVLSAMSGEIWIDAAQERVARLEGHLQRDTNYAWGILGRLNKGGWIVIEQADLGHRQWRVTRVQMQMKLRVLFKTRDFDTLEELTQYAPVNTGMDYRQAIQMLRATPINTAFSHR